MSSMVEGIESPVNRTWHVIYVRARHEKQVSLELSERRVESYLPMRKEVHQWSDRRKWVDVPLFSCYVFVKISKMDFNSVYQVNGFVKFVSLNGRPSVVPEKQIDAIRRVIEVCPDDVDVLDGMYAGKEAEIVSGALAGLRGEIVELVNRKTFVIRVDGLDKLLSVKVPAAAVRVIGTITSGKPEEATAGIAGCNLSRTT